MTPRKEPKKRYICECLKVTEADVLDAICKHEISDVKDITCFTQAGDGCTACHPALKKLLCERANPSSPARPAVQPDNSLSQPLL
jgi:NAD(P)H-nitrite reductase large subunit